MRFNLVLDLPDVPGQLLEVLEPMGRLGANIVAVIHQRDVKTERGTVPVQITIEGDKETLDMVMDALEAKDIQIMAVDGVLRKEQITTILVGDIVEEDVKETVTLLNQLEGVKVADLDLKMSDDPKNSATKMVMEADFGHKKKILKSIKEVGDQKGFLVINEV
ncbi:MULTISPECIES: amino acid-binding protein [Methanobacterium]|jgi:ACT domain-containing protein|uniref:Allosteric regulator of homoserine dehydrogenase n=1 Tax=Methanobacterium formicicum TaxID=2162 RepID=A0A090JXV6_METFO|nr:MULTISPECIES: amino acid-binding protein [Methanobacterium]AIS32189.1 allosteric regulator of homoserine dehydrogenase [Methanobacterium formicicum]AXV39305.1 MAG: amino acid-binding protein [Methanobacterium sp. BAmetb5]KUK71860.1 MAG: Amino acid-binding ACT domain-containing protein [Methanobacterium sp. 42_16]MBF4475362.1 amino acid-binding protein [Methanobacterium formicicum]MDD4810264.1 amino acid-binding protein [Methanobacterium formicicum]